MGTINKQVSRYEITAVYTHPEAKVDIVLVHGLNGDPYQTWTSKGNDVFWPADLLPHSLENQRANVLVYGYNADVYSSRHDRSASDNFIHQHAQTLVSTLVHYRRNEKTVDKPIIWVGHSLGGILIKRALLYSNDLQAEHLEDYRSVFVSTYGIIFLGTPHTGADMATWGRVLQAMSDAMVPRKLFDSEPVLLRTLKKDSEALQTINSHFLDIYQRYRIHMAHENRKTDIKGTKVMVVDSRSASPELPGITYYGIEATHSGMCKFDSLVAPGYLSVSAAIREWVEHSPSVIQVRWKVEEEDRRVRGKLQAFEHMSNLDKSTTRREEGVSVAMQTKAKLEVIEAPEPLPLLARSVRTDQGSQGAEDREEEPVFIHPDAFRPNSFFVGRAEELKTLHRLLMDPRRRSEGTAAVVVQCLPGGGKTHFARQYVFQHRSDYPGGVYWVHAKSRQEMEYCYWRIAKQLVKNDALRGHGLPEKKGKAKAQAGDAREMIGLVREWLNRREDWLLVLDGVQFDMAGLHEFIPDAKNSSLIFTSTERAVTGDPDFDNPSVMELGPLTLTDARDLLLLEMDRKQPWTQEDDSRARELVQLMGRLPLMIHVAAQHLKATREPLGRYLRSYRSRPKVGNLPAYKAVREQLQFRGATAALNLMSMLAFLDQHVPVEMLTLGLSALDKATPVMTMDAFRHKKSLDNTIAVLMAFGLLERTEGDDTASTSSRSSEHSSSHALSISTRENADQLDILCIHSVVQAFFVEALSEERQARFWLERAAQLWCHSYDEALRRIAEDPRTGLPDDYRRYHIHARRLAGHLERLTRRSTDALARLLDQIERRMLTTEDKFNRLSHSELQHGGQSGNGSAQVSVFERANSASQESDSTPPSSHESMASEDSLAMHPSQEPSSPGSPHQILRRPVLAAFNHDKSNPYHWHVPYPPSPCLMPPEPTVMKLDEGEDYGEGESATPVPASSWRPPASWRVPLQGRPGAVNMAEPSYFSIKKPTAARVSFSREFARGALSGPETPDESESPSEAQRQLTRINQTLPPPREDEEMEMDLDPPTQQMQEVVLQVADPHALLAQATTPLVVAIPMPLTVPVAPGTSPQIVLQLSTLQDITPLALQPTAGAGYRRASSTLSINRSRSRGPSSPAASDLQAEPLSAASTPTPTTDAQPATSRLRLRPPPSPLPNASGPEFATSFPPAGRGGVGAGKSRLWGLRFGRRRSDSGSGSASGGSRGSSSTSG